MKKKPIPSPKKTLILIRHAHRDTTRPTLDNGLSPKGKKQERRLRRHFKRRFPDEKPMVLSSPKRRCRETVEGLARDAEVPLRKDARLAELGAGGRERVVDFINTWRSERAALTVVCSHGDWIDEAARAATGATVNLKKGGWIEIVLEEGKTRLDGLIQSFKDFAD